MQHWKQQDFRVLVASMVIGVEYGETYFEGFIRDSDLGFIQTSATNNQKWQLGGPSIFQIISAWC